MGVVIVADHIEAERAQSVLAGEALEFAEQQGADAQATGTRKNRDAVDDKFAATRLVVEQSADGDSPQSIDDSKGAQQGPDIKGDEVASSVLHTADTDEFVPADRREGTSQIEGLAEQW